MSGSYVLETGVSRSLGAHLRGLGERCLVLCDRHPSDDFLGRMSAGIRAGGDVSSVEVMRVERPACSKELARSLAQDVRASGADLVVAFGSSKVLDLARAAMRCLQPDRPSLALVTSVVASNASVGSLAVMYGDDGLPNGFWKLDRAPELVAVDPLLVLDGPARLLSAAMGDQLASSLEAIDGARAAGAWRQGEQDHQRAMDVIFSQGEAALAEHAAGACGPALVAVLKAVTRYTPQQEASAAARACHVLGAALSADVRGAGWTHGEVVAACIPAELVLSGNEGDVPRWAALLGGLGLPAGLGALGIDVSDADDIMRLVGVAASCLIGQGSVIDLDRTVAVEAVLRAEGLLAEGIPRP